MPHKTLLGDVGDSDDFPSAMHNLIERALREMATRKLLGVTVNPLSTVGEYPFKFAVTVIAEGHESAEAHESLVEELEAMEIIVGEPTTTRIE